MTRRFSYGHPLHNIRTHLYDAFYDLLTTTVMTGCILWWLYERVFFLHILFIRRLVSFAYANDNSLIINVKIRKVLIIKYGFIFPLPPPIRNALSLFFPLTRGGRKVFFSLLSRLNNFLTVVNNNKKKGVSHMISNGTCMFCGRIYDVIIKSYFHLAVLLLLIFFFFTTHLSHRINYHV